MSTTKSHVKEISNCHLSFDGTIVSNGSVVKNLSVYFDRPLSMEKQVKAVTKFCYYQIRKYWSNSAINHRRRMQNLSFLTCHVTPRLRNALLFALDNPRQIPLTTSDLGRIIVIDMRLRLTLMMRSLVGLPHRETPTRFLQIVLKDGVI